MIIIDREYGKFEICLADDGTLDIVFDIYYYAPNGFHLCQNKSTEIRFSQEYGAEFRDDAGVMTDIGFRMLAYEAVESYIEQYLLV